MDTNILPSLPTDRQMTMPLNNGNQLCMHGGSKAAPNVATLLQALRRSKTSFAGPGTSVQGVVRTER